VVHGHLVVDFDAMRHASQSIQTGMGQLDARLAELDATGKRLIASWSGDARDAYLARQAGWERAAGQLRATLGDIKRALDGSLVDYMDTERRNRDLFPG
jgi:6 kDa early secretory antigenic target